MSKTFRAKTGAHNQTDDDFPGAVASTVIENPALLRRQGLADELDCSLRMIDHLQAQGMPCIYLGRSRRFILVEVIAWLKRKGGRA